MSEDIRWKQRFQNYKKALDVMKSAFDLAKSRELSNLEKQGVIKGFEFTFELAWNVMKDYLEDHGITDIIGSKSAIRYAFSNGLIEDGQVWMDMVKSRNISAHTYDEATAETLFGLIINSFFDAFVMLEKKVESMKK
jgi:nucleotidyltransferase substrate binding protein (TIGR01987 family)